MRRALGKGLSQLMGEESEAPTSVVTTSIRPNSQQPRKRFDEEALSDLALSISEVGILLPLIVRPIAEGQYELIAGERRWRAAQIAGLNEVPVIVRAASAQDSLEIALIENVQREDISPIECAHAYRQLADKFDLSQEEIAQRVGKSRPAVSNTMRLLNLPEPMQRAISDGTITEGHARALLMVEDDEKRLGLFTTIVEEGLSVRDAERLARLDWPVANDAPTKQPRPKRERDPHSLALERRMSERFGSPVTILHSAKGGKVVVEFYSEEELDHILDVIGIGL